MLMHTVFALLAVTTVAIAGDVPATPYAAFMADTRISEAQARAIAVQAFPGDVLASSLERADTRWVYAFTIRPLRPDWRSHTVQVDARDGSLVALVPLR